MADIFSALPMDEYCALCGAAIRAPMDRGGYLGLADWIVYKPGRGRFVPRRRPICAGCAEELAAAEAAEIEAAAPIEAAYQAMAREAAA